MRCDLLGYRKAECEQGPNAERVVLLAKRCLRAGIDTVYGDSPGSA